METNRLINIILSDLAVENLKTQERLEFLVNSNDDIDSKVGSIKKLLSNLVLNEMATAKFHELINTGKKE